MELFASEKQQVLDLDCSKELNYCYKIYWPSFGMACGNPTFNELGKVLTKVALEFSCLVLCSPDWGAHGKTEYWRTLLRKLTPTSNQLLDDAIYVSLGSKTPIWNPGWGSMLSVLDGSLAPVSRRDLNPTIVQEIQRESIGCTVDVLKHRLRPRDAVETTRGGDDYFVLDAAAPHTPCHVPNADVVSECGLSKVPSSIHYDDEANHVTFFVQNRVDELENAEYPTQQEAPFLHEGRGAIARGVGPPIVTERVCGLQEKSRRKIAVLSEAYPQVMAVEARVHERCFPA